MARKKRAKTPAMQADPTPAVLVGAVALVFFLVQVVVLPGAFSPFRLPKQAVAVAGLVLVVGIGLTLGLVRGRLRLPAGPLAAVLVAYPVLLAVSSLWAASWRRALASSVIAAVWTTGTVWLGSLSPSERVRVVRWTTLGMAVSAAVLLLQLANVHVIPLTPETSRARMGLTGLTGNPADMTMAIVLLLPLIIPLGTGKRSWRRWIIPSVLAAVAAVTQSLTGIAALMTLLLALLLLLGTRRTWIVSAAAVVTISVIALVAGIGTRLDRQVDNLRAGDWNAVLSGRVDGWSAAAQIVIDHPLLGAGGGGFTQLFFPARLAYLEHHGGLGNRDELATHFEWAHCDPLQLLAELGLPGALWLVALVVLVWHQRTRGDPVLLLAAAALAPFALLHYPLHLAVGLIPASLVLARVLHDRELKTVNLSGLSARPVLAGLLVVCSVLVGVWQARGVYLDRWRGEAEQVLLASQQASAVQAAAIAASVEQRAGQHLQRSPDAAPWLWRLVARARLARGDAVGAEQAFSTANGLWPHEEAEFGLGLALASQGRRSEALTHLGRVCRLNPRLMELIAEEELRRAVRDYLETVAARK